MSEKYQLIFHKKALKEWDKLPKPLQQQLKKKLAERVINPKVPSALLSGGKNFYKIKLRSAGYRLVYQVRDNTMVILVLAIGKRENNEIYAELENRTLH